MASNFDSSRGAAHSKFFSSPAHNRYDDGRGPGRPHIKNGARPGDNIGAGMVWTTDERHHNSNNNSHSNHTPLDISDETTPAGVARNQASQPPPTQALATARAKLAAAELEVVRAENEALRQENEALRLGTPSSGGGGGTPGGGPGGGLARGRSSFLESLEVEPANNMGAALPGAVLPATQVKPHASPGAPAGLAPQGPAGMPSRRQYGRGQDTAEREANAQEHDELAYNNAHRRGVPWDGHGRRGGDVSEMIRYEPASPSHVKRNRVPRDHIGLGMVWNQTDGHAEPVGFGERGPRGQTHWPKDHEVLGSTPRANGTWPRPRA